MFRSLHQSLSGPIQAEKKEWVARVHNMEKIHKVQHKKFSRNNFINLCETSSKINCATTLVEKILKFSTWSSLNKFICWLQPINISNTLNELHISIYFITLSTLTLLKQSRYIISDPKISNIVVFSHILMKQLLVPSRRDKSVWPRSRGSWTGASRRGTTSYLVWGI